ASPARWRRNSSTTASALRSSVTSPDGPMRANLCATSSPRQIADRGSALRPISTSSPIGLRRSEQPDPGKRLHADLRLRRAAAHASISTVVRCPGRTHWQRGYCMALSILDVGLRLGAAALAGAAIVINRDLTNKPIGMRTLGLVALGAASATVAVIE